MLIRNAKNWSTHSTLNAFAWSCTSFVVITFMMFNLGSDFYGAHSYKFYFIVATFLAYFFGYRPATIFIIFSSGHFIYINNGVIISFNRLLFFCSWHL